MKRLLPLAAMLLAASAVFAQSDKPAPPLGPKAEKLIDELLPVCSAPVTMKRTGLQHALPAGMTGNVIQADSERGWCKNQWVAVSSDTGGFFFGVPWFLDDMHGTIEEKLTQFTWNNLHQNYTAVVDRQKTRDGLYRVTLQQTTEFGKLPMEGEADPAGTVFFIGHFMPLTTNARSERLKQLDKYIADSPWSGSTKPQVTVIEFSDFECPSCQRAASYMKPILAAHADKVRYIRYDMPLVTMHPWAFSAAVAGRAVYRQKPDLFWAYKEQIYQNQDNLTAFTIDKFARGFAEEHELDMKRYDADIESPQLRAEILNGAGAAFWSDIRATPTYVVNGVNVDPGTDGGALAAYVEKLLK